MEEKIELHLEFELLLQILDDLFYLEDNDSFLFSLEDNDSFLSLMDALPPEWQEKILARWEAELDDELPSPPGRGAGGEGQ